jgi:PTS system mannose-specific IIB component/fructoselysine and glucoselysine-specific PTS system IIB component
VTLSLVRLDDRLIHGQVVVGWGHAIHAEVILLIDDEVSASEWEQELYRMGVPDDVEVEFSSTASAPAALARWAESPKRTIVLLADVDSLIKVCRPPGPVQVVNLGGLHERNGRTRRSRYIYLTEAEAEKLKALRDAGVEVTAQDVPTAREVPLEDLV